MNSIFKFKKFTVNQSQTAMKVGTDAVLLGAWVNLGSEINSILDIGAGTGILSLMLAQRSNAELIDAVEIDDQAYEQCVENFENSNWSDRLFCYHGDFTDFSDQLDEKYDLVICNPPFYNSTLINNSRQKARNNQALPFTRLIEGVTKIISEDGSFNIIIPYELEDELISLCSQKKLQARRILRVKGHHGSKFKRSIIEFAFTRRTTEIQELVIELERHKYTDDYIELTKEFYLKM